MDANLQNAGSGAGGAPRSIASRMRIAAAIPRSGVSKVAITASPMVFTMAPLSEAMISWSNLKMLIYEIEGDEVANRFIKLGRAFEMIAEQESKAQDLQALANG